MSTAGASAEAIQFHYDLSNEFYQLWLDDTMTYSCPMWRDPGDSLETAQRRKLEWHATSCRADGAQRVLDIGCGWGGMLRYLVGSRGVRSATGLTLSKAQLAWVNAHPDPRIEVRLESWFDHAPAEPYDAIISIGAFEHFARPELSGPERIETYRTFFAKCREMLVPGARLSLQTIAYGIGRYKKGVFSAVFPESDLPRLAEISTAAEPFFEIVTLLNDRIDYHRTCELWLQRLIQRRAEAVACVGEDATTAYERYLEAVVHGFKIRAFDLYRISFRRMDDRRA